MTQNEYNAKMAEVRKWPEWLLWAVTLWAEARGESLVGKLAVAYVIKSRHESKQLWDDILAPKQFSCWNYYPKKQTTDPNFEKMLKLDIYHDAAFQQCIQIVFQVMLSWASNPFKGADHYHTVNINPSWAKSMKVVGKEGNHIFLSSVA